MLLTRVVFSSITAILCFGLAWFALISNPSHRLNRSFAIFCAGHAIWNIGGYSLFFLDYHTGLTIYRACQALGLLSTWGQLSFLQEILGIHDRRGATLARRALLLILLIVVPLAFTDIGMREYTLEAGKEMRFSRAAGGLHLVMIGAIMSLLLVLMGVVVSHLRRASGTKRNQLKFVGLAMSLQVATLIFYFVSFTGLDLPWTYFPLQIVTFLCFGYAIFKYRLFEFRVWVARVVIFGGVYSAVLAVPFIVLPFHHWLADRIASDPWIIPAALVVYGILFSLAPVVAHRLRVQADNRRWRDLQRHLDVLREAAARFAEEKQTSLESVADRSLDLFRTFYGSRASGTPAFLMVAINDGKKGRVVKTVPPHSVDEALLDRYLQTLQDLDAPWDAQPFGQTDIEQRVISGHAPAPVLLVERLLAFMRANAIELCCPISSDGKRYGALLFGPKSEGIFLPQEIYTMQLVASHIAGAVRTSELLEMTRELAGLDRLKTDFISNITHEFKSPINIVESIVDSLSRDASDGRIRPSRLLDYLGIIRHNTERLNLFIQNLLEISKIRDSKVTLTLLPASLSQIVQEAARFIRPLAEEKGLRLDLSFPEPLTVTVDREKMNQVFCNLFSNAVKFTDAGAVTASAARVNGQIRVTVKDTGLGMDPAYTSQIFDRFFQVPVDDSPGRAKGTGLGLAIAKAWVEAHGGRIWAESDGPGQGTAVIVEIPAEPA